MSSEGTRNPERAVHAGIRVCMSLALCIALWAPAQLRAACASPLPSGALRELDGRIDSDPSGVLAEARRQLRASTTDAPFLEAQLYALIADAASLSDDDAQVRLAVSEGLGRLTRLPDSTDRRSLQVRLALTAADSPQNSTDVTVSIERLDQLERTLAPLSLERACLLVVRSHLNMQALRDEEAATDGLNAYRLATGLREKDAAADAAHQLAFAYARAGLSEDAESLISESNAYYEAHGATARLANGLYLQAEILEQKHDYDRALALNGAVRTLNARANQKIDVAMDDVQKCGILLLMSRLESARQSCLNAEPTLAAAGREDLVAQVEKHLARIDIARGRPAQAIARLDKVLASGAEKISAQALPAIYQYRSEALSQVGRYRDSLRDLQEAARLSTANDAARHSIAAARLKERITSETLREEKLVLEAQLHAERERTTYQAKRSRLGLALSNAGALLLLAVAYFFFRRAGRDRALRAAASSLESQAHVIATLHEGVLLVDRLGQIRYANAAAAHLCGRTREAMQDMQAETLGIRPEHMGAGDPAVHIGSIGGAYELDWAGADGRHRSILLTCSPVTLHDDALTVCILQDVTELRRLERRLFASSNDERERIGTEIQEGLGQELANVARLLKGVAGRSSSDESKLEYLSSLVNELVETSHSIVQGLSPVHIGRGSLPEALYRLAEDQSLKHGIRIACRCDMGDLRLGPWQADHLFRIARGCLDLARVDRVAGDIALELRVAGAGLTVSVTTERVDVAFTRSHQDHEWQAIVYLSKVIGGVARAEVLADSVGLRTVTVPLAPLVLGTAGRRMAHVPAMSLMEGPPAD